MPSCREKKKLLTRLILIGRLVFFPPCFSGLYALYAVTFPFLLHSSSPSFTSPTPLSPTPSTNFISHWVSVCVCPLLLVVTQAHSHLVQLCTVLLQLLLSSFSSVLTVCYRFSAPRCCAFRLPPASLVAFALHPLFVSASAQ